MNKVLRVGVIVRTHGIRGEVKVYPTTDSPDRFNELKYVFAEQDGRRAKLCIEHVKYFKNLVILKLEGVESIDEAEKYRGADILIPREAGVELKEGEHYIADIIGISVVTDDGRELGAVKDVLETGANDVYIVERKGERDLLLPAIKECILSVDTDNDVMTVHLMDGLLDL